MYTQNGYEVENEFNGYVKENPFVDMCVTHENEIIPTHDYYKKIHPEKEEAEYVSAISSRMNRKSVSSHFSQYMERSI